MNATQALSKPKLKLSELKFPENGGYITCKGLQKGQNQKAERDTYLTIDEVNKILRTIKESDYPEAQRDRDHCALFLGFYFGLRVYEASIIERNCFRHIAKGQVYVRRAKSVPRIKVICAHCDRKFNISAKKIGEERACVRCGRPVQIHSKKKIDLDPPEQALPVVESKVTEYIQTYMSKLKPEQRWFFDGKHRPDAPLEEIPHISIRQLERIFAHWTIKAGLDPLYSWHSLRHARGMFLYERFNDLKMVQDMLGHKSMASTEIYMHMSPKRKAAYRESLDQVFETF
jgi:integrase